MTAIKPLHALREQRHLSLSLGCEKPNAVVMSSSLGVLAVCSQHIFWAELSSLRFIVRQVRNSKRALDNAEGENVSFRSARCCSGRTLHLKYEVCWPRFSCGECRRFKPRHWLTWSPGKCLVIALATYTFFLWCYIVLKYSQPKKKLAK